jgi:hypothetical protein
MLVAALVAQEPNEHLKPMAWVVGTWEGAGKYGDNEFTDTVTYELTHNGNFIKWTAEARMDGKVVHSETGMLGYDAAKKKLVWFSFTLDGSIGQGEQDESKQENEWVFASSVGNEPPWNDGKSIWRKIDADTYESEARTKQGEEYVSFFSGTYRRKK